MSQMEPITPEPILQAFTGVWVTGIVKGGIQSGLFAALCKEPGSAEALARSIGAPERTTRIVCDALVGLRFLAKQDGTYRPAPFVEAFLDPDKPSYLGSMVNVLSSPHLWDAFGNVAGALRNGGTLMEQNALMPEHPFWEVFAESTFAFGMPMAQTLAAAVREQGLPAEARIADLACGTGVYGLVLASQSPQAQLTLVDWPNVLEHTQRYVQRMGLGDRTTFVRGDIFEVDHGRDLDLVILANVHHHFDAETCIRLNRRVHQSLRPGGLAAVIDFVPDEARAEDTLALMFGCVMMVWTPRGNVFTESEYGRMFTEAGFGEPRRVQPPGVPQAVLLFRA